MSDLPEQSEPAGRGGAAPRSTLWRGILGTAPVISTAITLELGRTLVVDSFGDVEAVKTVADTLRVFSVLLVAGGLLFAGYRWYARRRDGERLARTRELLAALNQPGVQVGGIGPPPGATPPTSVAHQQWPDAAILRELPVSDYDSAALLAVASAIAQVRHRPPAVGSPQPDTAGAVIARWHRDRVLTEPSAGRHWVNMMSENPPRAAVYANPAWAAAICALLRHHAECASVRVVALGHPGYAPAARRWFTAHARELYDLAAACAAPDLRDRIPFSALPELARVADALEIWYTLSAAGTPTGDQFAELCRHMAAIPGMSAFPLHGALLQLRGGRTTPTRRFRPRQWSTGVAARWEHESALSDFGDAPEHAGLLARRLERVWWMLPRTDVEAEVCVLINLAVAELAAGRFEAAGDRLDLVFARTEGGRDPSGRVHAHEIAGAVHWARGDSVAAVHSWLIALTGYRALDDPAGTGRCLYHLGATLVLAPELGGTAIPTEHSLVRDEVWRQAVVWLDEAAACDPPAIGRALALEDYRGMVPASIASAAPPTGGDRSPLEIDDPHLWIARREP
ncbi:hypothetical protein [Nocardia higoensis]|uniref:hypothetical protein n=1 Tax=Nocardia higoensis TaxID=228599 RepID=UPI0003001C71|nr:hypothetical protein [Nocardia higoensis]